MRNKSNVIDHILDMNKVHLGRQFEIYQNHVYRVFILCQKIDNSPENIEKYAIASAFHDLGIWTDKTFDYLEPSMNQAKKYLIENNKEQCLEEILLMIDMHHKRSRYKGAYEGTVETFRRADWIDVTKGWMSFNISKVEIKELVNEYPIAGFHNFFFHKQSKTF